jgi:hypothetical protein
MSAAEINLIAISNTHANEALSKQTWSSLIDRNAAHFFPLHLRLAETRHVTADLLQEAGSIGHAPSMHAMLETMLYTPPQVDISKYRYGRSKTRTNAIGMWWQWKNSLLLVPPISSLKKAIAYSAHGLTVYYGTGNEAPIRLFYWVILSRKDLYACICFTTGFTYICSLAAIERVSPLLYTGPMDIQMYFYPVYVRARIGVQRVASCVIWQVFGKSVFEGDQEKDKKRLKPVKPVKPKTRKQKSEREDNKEKEEENDPRTEGAVL